jgi:protein tyrosine phosphatase (PTP) superfamily phosphohydrolase (DUF442 family)
MEGFERPADLIFNRGLIADPTEFARENNAASWLYLCGEDFAQTEGGMSYADVRAAVSASENIAVDTVPLTMDIARQQVAALDGLSRPTLVTCRTGPKSSALVYLYAGLKAGATADEVMARAHADGAPFVGAEPLKAWVTQGLDELR